jgi:hypothetical protein
MVVIIAHIYQKKLFMLQLLGCRLWAVGESSLYTPGPGPGSPPIMRHLLLHIIQLHIIQLHMIQLHIIQLHIIRSKQQDIRHCANAVQ